MDVVGEVIEVVVVDGVVGCPETVVVEATPVDDREAEAVVVVEVVGFE
jgi:hypothetical protein